MINNNKRNEYLKKWYKKYQSFDSVDLADSYEEFFEAIIEIYNKGFEDGLQKGYDNEYGEGFQEAMQKQWDEADRKKAEKLGKNAEHK